MDTCLSTIIYNSYILGMAHANCQTCKQEQKPNLPHNPKSSIVHRTSSIVHCP